MKKIRLIKPIYTNGAKQMALDEAILISCSKGKSPPTLRFYQFDPPAITIGFHQNIKNFNLEKIQKKGFDIVRRMTGGTAVLHKDDFVYSLVFPEKGLPKKIVDVYNYLSDGLIEGLSHLGVSATKKDIFSNKREDTCYINSNPYDIVFDFKGESKKISGNALTRSDGYIMEQGTIIIKNNIEELLDCQNLSDKNRIKLYKMAIKKVTCIESILGRIPPFSEIENSIKKGFTDFFSKEGYILEEGELTNYEKTLAEKLYNEKYFTHQWRDSK